jgi:putative tryptophan/tyrosine transport system substrate-binding protein
LNASPFIDAPQEIKSMPRCVGIRLLAERHRYPLTDPSQFDILGFGPGWRGSNAQGEDIATAIEAVKGRAEAVYVCTDGLVNANRIRINALALAARLPTMHGCRDYVEAGGLMSYGANLPNLFRRAAEYVNKILRGAKPADIPVEQPTKFDLIVNLTTAKTLGIDVPPTLLARADEVIE